MSKEKDVKRLRKSLHDTRDILNHLIKETSADMEKKWGTTRGDAEKKLQEAGKRFEKRYEETRSNLENTLKAVSKDIEKKYPQQKKEAEKAIAKAGGAALNGAALKAGGAALSGAALKAGGAALSGAAIYKYKDASAEAKKKLAEFRTVADAKTKDLKFRAADVLQDFAAGALTLRNRLEPKTRYALRNEKEKHHLGKGGYFKRFIALAIVIVSKKDQLLSLGQQLYTKLQDDEARQSLKEDAIGQYDTMRRLIKAYANGHYKEFPYTSILKIVAAVVYFVSVVDLIPDFIPVLGLTDDLAVLAWVYSSVKDDLQQFVDWEEANERRREKMESQKNSAKPAAAAADREAASPNTTTPTVRSSTSPATTPAGTPGVIGGISTNTADSAGTNKISGSGSNTGSSGGNASSTSGSAGNSSGAGKGGNNSNQKSGGPSSGRS